MGAVQELESLGWSCVLGETSLQELGRHVLGETSLQKLGRYVVGETSLQDPLHLLLHPCLGKGNYWMLGCTDQIHEMYMLTVCVCVCVGCWINFTKKCHWHVSLPHKYTHMLSREIAYMLWGRHHSKS